MKCVHSQSAHKSSRVQITSMQNLEYWDIMGYVTDLHLCIITASSKMMIMVDVLAFVLLKAIVVDKCFCLLLQRVTYSNELWVMYFAKVHLDADVGEVWVKGAKGAGPKENWNTMDSNPCCGATGLMTKSSCCHYVSGKYKTLELSFFQNIKYK